MNKAGVDKIDCCIVCHSKNCVKYLFKEKDCVVCDKCDAVYGVNPPQHKEQFDNQVGFSGGMIRKIGVSTISRRFRDILSGQYIRYLKEKTEFNFCNVLDVGAHFGNLVNKFNEFGINAEGLEASKEFSNFSVTDKITYGYFDENFKSDKKYDLITFTQMMYYVKDPIMMVNHAKNFLTKSGLIFISTYNTNSSEFRKNKNFFEDSYNIVQSKKNFETLNGFKLVDYTTYKSDMITNMVNNTDKTNILKNYLTFHFRKPFEEDIDGHQAYILLKPI